MSSQWSALESALVDGAVGLAVSFVVATLLLSYLIRVFKQRGYVGVDVHKVDRPEVAEMGGVGLVLGLLCGLFAAFLLERFIYFHDFQTTFTLRLLNGASVQLFLYRAATGARIYELITAVAAVALVGLFDDFYPLKGRQKPLVTLGLSAIALSIVALVPYYATILGQFSSDPRRLSFYFVPYIEIPGRSPISLAYLFPLILLFAVTIGANAMNMMDVYNGIMPATTAIVTVALIISAFILERYEALYLLLPFLGAILAYYRFNRYPARVFSGDVGSLAVGAGLVMIAFLGRLEIVLLIAFIPFIINGLDTLLSVGFRERRDMDARPTLFGTDGKIALNPNPKAPVPLANLFLLDGPKTEKELIRNFLCTVAFSSTLAVVTALVMWALGG